MYRVILESEILGSCYIPKLQDQQLPAAKDGSWLLTVSTSHIYFGANLYFPYHRISGQNIPCGLLFMYYSLLELLVYKVLELHVLFRIHSSDILQWRMSC